LPRAPREREREARVETEWEAGVEREREARLSLARPQRWLGGREAVRQKEGGVKKP
jgi:hypothetical protein